jgi:hypothetical protein
LLKPTASDEVKFLQILTYRSLLPKGFLWKANGSTNPQNTEGLSQRDLGIALIIFLLWLSINPLESRDGFLLFLYPSAKADGE